MTFDASEDVKVTVPLVTALVNCVKLNCVDLPRPTVKNAVPEQVIKQESAGCNDTTADPLIRSPPVGETVRVPVPPFLTTTNQSLPSVEDDDSVNVPAPPVQT
jgi:hypothetical protein